MEDVSHLLNWISKRLREEIIDLDRPFDEAVGIVMDALNREDRKLLALFHVENKAHAFTSLKATIEKMLSDTP